MYYLGPVYFNVSSFVRGINYEELIQIFETQSHVQLLLIVY